MLIGFLLGKHVFACLSDVLNSDNVDKFCRQNKIGMKLKLIIEFFHRKKQQGIPIYLHGNYEIVFLQCAQILRGSISNRV